jgi:precorrin-6A/cobalt-precorrin-6A reductase
MPGSTLPRKRVLILGGTTEARALADGAHARFAPRLEVISSLAGRIAPDQPRKGRLRIGGFGGAEGLAAYLAGEAIDLVVDATHPFADRISTHAARACAAARVPRLMLVRPSWRPKAGDAWVEVDSFAAAAEMVARSARRVFLTIGPAELAAFGWLSGVWVLVRLFQRPETLLPLHHYQVVVSRPPFSVADERRLLVEHRIDTLVTKNAGGPLAGKLAAARAEGVRVVMITRPAAPPGERVATPEEALAWLECRL